MLLTSNATSGANRQHNRPRRALAEPTTRIIMLKDNAPATPQTLDLIDRWLSATEEFQLEFEEPDWG